VLAPGQLGVEAGADLQQRADPAAQAGVPRGRPGDARQDLEQRRFAGPVAPDDADGLAGPDVEADVAQGPELRGGGGATEGARQHLHDALAQRQVVAALAGGLDPVALADVVDDDRRGHGAHAPEPAAPARALAGAAGSWSDDVREPV